ncbi:MAG TPA: dihydrolipoamide acetyltransferase family protein [Solirubrobacteraceae bacterium]|nr:dihydrolipoamide acetyltransferase family protein [Solirubrobacteraceae bacterium]
MAEIVMPRLSDTMEEGTILRWIKRDGEHVSRGEELVEIETDKAAMVYESDQDGTLQLLAAEGDTLPVGQVIARVGGDEGEVASGGDGASAAGEPEPAGDREPSDGAGQDSEEALVESVVATGAPTTQSLVGGAARTATPGPGAPPDAGDSDGEGGRVKASPLARRIAHERGVDLARLAGSGPGGRIVKADVEAAAAGVAPTPAAAAGEPPAAVASPSGPSPGATREDPATAKGQTSTQELSRMQQTIARRMAESKATIPDFTLQSDVDMEACVALRTELKRISSQDAPTYNDMVVKACALALREHPRANGSYRDGVLQLHSRVNVGIAVAAQDALVVPTVFDADEKSLGEIAREARGLAARVRDGTITPPELGGGTFTVSNLGMYGIRSFSAIINPPQAAILSVGSVERRAVVREQELVARHTMTLSLVCDHRILYGADAAEFLARVRELLQTPASLTL